MLHGNAPQSDEEIRPVVEALRRLDPLLDLRWNPKAVMVAKGRYDILGGRIDPRYDGRWEIIRHNTPTRLEDSRDWVRITQVTAPATRTDGLLLMQEDGPYAPVGHWLVTFMEQWDAAQRHFAAHMDRVWAEHADVERGDTSESDDARREATEKVYSEHAGAYHLPVSTTAKGAPWLRSLADRLIPASNPKE